MTIEPDIQLFDSLTLSQGEIDELLAEWTVAKFSTGDAEWLRVRAEATRKMKRRLWKYKAGALLGSARKNGGYRDERFVDKEYSRTWNSLDWPENTAESASKMTIACEQADAGYLLYRSSLNRLALVLLARTIDQLKPKRVLEVGAGQGLNLLSLCSRFPDVEFTGVELTQTGVERARAVQQADALPDAVVNFIPWTDIDRQAYRRIRFTQGNAVALDFEDASFDLVFSNVALEQMETIKHQALPEVSRVSSGYVAMCEPFADFNADPLRKLSIQAKNYLTVAVAELPQYAMEPVHVFSDWPQKIMSGNGFVVARPLR